MKTNETQTVTLEQLTPEQLAQLKQQFKAQRKARSAGREGYKSLVTNMLQEKDGTGFKNTTADILAALQAKSLVGKDLDAPTRAEELKRIQTVKQKLEKKNEYKGKVGYKPSPHAVGPLTVERVLAFIADASAADRATLKKALK